MPLEWQCPCGAWLPIAYGRHTHFIVREPTLEEMVAGRRVQEMGGQRSDVTAQHAEAESAYWRNGTELTRDVG